MGEITRMKTAPRAGRQVKRSGKKLSAAQLAQRYLEIQRLRQQLSRAQSAANAG